MARIRTIKPGFFTSEDVAALSMRARLTWIGLWTYADDNGRGKDNTKLIKAALYPLDTISLRQVEDDMAELEHAGRISRYVVEGLPYFEVTAWTEHQRINRPTGSKIPANPDSVSDHGALTEPSLSPHARKGREGNGGEASKRGSAERPPPRCAKHLRSKTDEPCRACGTARREHDAWKPSSPTLPKLIDVLNAETCEAHGAELGRCALCRKGATQ